MGIKFLLEDNKTFRGKMERSILLVVAFFLSINSSVFASNTALTTKEPVSQQETITATGTVVDETGLTMPGVSVVAVGTTNGATTDFDGNFTIDVPEGTTLEFSFMGYKTIDLKASTTPMNIAMQPDAAALDEVVVVGYGVQKKKLNTGANINMKGDKIAEQTTTNAIDALQGISPGVNITRSSAQPGSSTKVFIRGIGTIGDASPLYIVDGVIVSSIDYLSPTDIASLDVLKDAASAAIYGSRAANGVILVTTKNGKKSVEPYMNINFDSYVGIQNVINQPEMLNAQQFMDIQNEARANEHQGPYDFEKIMGPYAWSKYQNGWKGTNWFDEMKIKNGVIQNYALNLTGGSANSIYSFGASYHGNEGVFGKQANSGFKRLTLRLNSEHTLYKNEEHDILKFGENLTYTNSAMPSVRMNGLYNNDIHSSLVTTPLLPVYNEQGEYHYALGAPYQLQANPVAIMDYNSRNVTDKNNKIVGNFYLELEPIANLTIRSSYGLEGSFGTYRSWMPAYNLSTKGSGVNPFDKVSQRTYQKYSYTFTNTVNYKFSVNDVHNFVLLAGTEMNKVTQNWRQQGKNSNGIFNDPTYAYLDNYPVVDPALTESNGSDNYGQAVLSYFGRASYNYDEKYMMTVVARADGSSNFTKENRWGFFPSVSAGWVVTNENFLNDSNVFDFLKVRASWGQNGNQNIGAFQYANTISYENADYYYGEDKTRITPGGYPSRIANPDVTWETSEQTNIGFDANFLHSKLRLNVDLYQKDTKDWLVVAPIISTYGTNPSAINGGKIRNSGIELALSYNNEIGDFHYNISGSFAYNKNEVVAIDNGEGIIHGTNNSLTHGISEISRVEVGHPIGYFWGFKTDGIIQNQAEADAYNHAISSDPRKGKIGPGDFRYQDLNNDGKINDDDKTSLGDPNPKYNFGLQLNMNYKQFYMNIVGTGQAGMQIAKSYRGWNKDMENYTTDVFDRWHGEGTSNTYPKLSSKGNQNMLQMSDFFVHDATYFRISNVTVGYNFKPIEDSFFKGGKVYFQVRNLATFTSYKGMDPEVGYGGKDKWASGIDLGMYPQSRSFIIGVNFNF